MDEKRAIAFCEILKEIKDCFGDEIVFETKRLKAILSDLNLKYKDEEKKFLFLINENQDFVRNVHRYQDISIESVTREIENRCGFNREVAAFMTQALLIITG